MLFIDREFLIRICYLLLHFTHPIALEVNLLQIWTEPNSTVWNLGSMCIFFFSKGGFHQRANDWELQKVVEHTLRIRSVSGDIRKQLNKEWVCNWSKLKIKGKGKVLPVLLTEHHAMKAFTLVTLWQCFSTAGPRPGTGPGPQRSITNLNVNLYLSTCHTVYIIVLILFMIMP
jgi:hypothetical protein